ncbi:hypothetical protein TYRP_014639, partial [Tyrophagus putrescentiae]
GGIGEHVDGIEWAHPQAKDALGAVALKEGGEAGPSLPWAKSCLPCGLKRSRLPSSSDRSTLGPGMRSTWARKARYRVMSQYLFDRNVTTSKIDVFYDSMERIAATFNDRFAEIAREIRAISEGQLNSSDSICYRSIVQVLESGYRYKWSAKMLHSTSILHSPPITSSLLSESLSSLGDFDQCLSAKPFLHHFRPKYCLVHVMTPQFPFEFTFPPSKESTSYLLKLSHQWAVARNRLTMLAGVCLPSVCSSKEIQKLLEKSANSTSQILCCFHLGKNFSSLFGASSKKVSSSESSSKQNTNLPKYDLRFLHGARLLLTTFTVSAHAFTSIPVSFFSRVSHFKNYPSFYEKSQAQYGLLDPIGDRGGFLMDFFFLFSGFLTSYLLLNLKDKMKRPPSLLLYAGLRWIRLAPSFAAFTALSIVVQKAGVSGPLAHADLTDPHVRGCRSSAWWWGQLLLPLNNWWKMEDSCGPHLWIPFTDIRLLYTTPLIRVLPYFLGVLIAVHLLESPELCPKKRKHQELIFWSCFALTVLVILSPTPSLITESGSALLATLYYLLLQSFHSILAAFFFYRFLISRGSHFKKLFYSPAMLPFSRLSYGMYLLNPLLIWTYYSSVRTPVELGSAWRQMLFMASIYFGSFVCSMGLYVLVEAPFAALSNVVISRSAAEGKAKEK